MMIFERMVNGLSRALIWVAGVLLVVLIGVTVNEVFGRYVLNDPSIWAYDLSYMLTAALMSLACPYAMKEDAHIRIDVFSNRLPGKVRLGVSIVFMAGLWMPAILALGFASSELAWNAFLSDRRILASAWKPVVWPIYLVFAVGFAALALQTIVNVWWDIRKLAGGDTADYQ